MKLQDYIHYYIGCKMIRSSHWEPQNEPYILNFEVIREAVEFGDRPLLRRTQDLTEQEAEKLAMIYSGADSVKRVKGTVGNWHYFTCSFDGAESETLIISSDGCAWYAHYFDENAPGFRNIINEHEATHYLLKQHFDLFGLIDAGLAVDIKTITP